MKPEDVTTSDSGVINAFKLLDKPRTGRDNILSRLAYIRLAHVFESLEKIVASDRRNGRLLARKSGYRNASVVVDIYIEAQEQVGISRYEVKQRKLVVLDLQAVRKVSSGVSRDLQTGYQGSREARYS